VAAIIVMIIIIIIIINNKPTSVGEDVKKLEPSYIAGGTVKWYSYRGKQFDSSSKS
jgi:hypothetical protein